MFTFENEIAMNDVDDGISPKSLIWEKLWAERVGVGFRLILVGCSQYRSLENLVPRFAVMMLALFRGFKDQ